MDGDYVLKGLLIKHGYNLSGEQYVNGNRQWNTVTLNLSDDGLVTIPAEYIDGDLNVEILFTNIADKASKWTCLYMFGNIDGLYDADLNLESRLFYS